MAARFLFTFCAVFSCSSAFRFLAPPQLAQFGEIYSVVPRQINYAASDYLSRNFSVFIPIDYTGCLPPAASLQTANATSLPPNTVVWLYGPAPCPPNPYDLGSRFVAWQNAGAAGIINGSPQEAPADVAGTVTFRGFGTTIQEIKIPVEMFHALKSTLFNVDATTNPVVDTFEFLFIPGLTSARLQFSPPIRSRIYLNQLSPGTPWSGIQWTTWAVTLLAITFTSFKLSR